MSQTSDWEPLTEQERVSYPGELAAVPARPAGPVVAPAVAALSAPAPAPPPVAASAAVATKAAASNPGAELVLAALKHKIGKAPASHSLIADVQRREQRQQQKQRAGQAPALAACKPVHCAVQKKDLPLEIEYEIGENGRDAREEQAWFEALPAAERERLHAAWASKREQAFAQRPVQRRNQNRRTVAAIVVFVAVIFAGSGAIWHATLGAGICCGIAWRYASPCRYRDPLIAFGCLLGAQVIAWIAQASGGLSSSLWMDAVLLMAFAAVVGFDGEIKRTGGFDAK